MMKKLILGSVVTAALVFTGCGSNDDDAPAADTQAPVVNATASGAAAAALTLATDNVAVTEISITGADAASFTVNADKTVTIPATPGTYHITVTAKDAAGHSKTGDVVVTVTAGEGHGGGNSTRTAEHPYIDSDVVTIGGHKWLKIKGSSGGADDLLNEDNTTAYSYRRAWSDANSTCNTLALDGGNWHLPTREEAQALFPDFSLGNTDANGVTSFTGTLDAAVIGENSDVANAVIWTNDGANEGIYIGGHTYNYTNGDNAPFSFTCTK